jgi:hypothetical protein
VKDLKTLLKRFRTLTEDLETAKRNAIELYHVHGIDNLAVLPMTGYGDQSEWRFFKIKKFACRALKGRGANSGIRVIYAYSDKSKAVVLLEMYFKADQESESRGRINSFLSTQCRT